MAYRDVEHGFFFPAQSDLNWAQTFRMTMRAPAIANRIFDTLEHAQAYIDDYSDKASAVPGLILCVTEDPVADNNGMWLVLSVRSDSFAPSGTMRRVDERSVINVTNLTTDLEPYTEPGIYFIRNSVTEMGYVLYVQRNTQQGQIIQILARYSGYEARIGEGNPVVWGDYVSYSYITSNDLGATQGVKMEGLTFKAALDSYAVDNNPSTMKVALNNLGELIVSDTMFAGTTNSSVEESTVYMWQNTDYNIVAYTKIPKSSMPDGWQGDIFVCEDGVNWKFGYAVYQAATQGGVLYDNTTGRYLSATANTRKAKIMKVGNGLLTIQRNGTTVGSFFANASSNTTLNIQVPTSASDVNALPSSTKYGASLQMSIDNSYEEVDTPTGNPQAQGWFERSGTAPNYIYTPTEDTSVVAGKTYYTGPTYVVTIVMKDQDGTQLGTAQQIDLPLESVVVGGAYDSQTKKVILTLQNGSTVEFSVADLVSGLQSEITSQNKLSSDLVDDSGATNKFVTDTQKTKLNNLPDIKTIGSNLTLDNDGRLNATDTTYGNFVGADSQDGSSGLVPQPLVADKGKFLKGDGTWSPVQENVQADWDQTNSNLPDFVKNKPIIEGTLTMSGTAPYDTYTITGLDDVKTPGIYVFNAKVFNDNFSLPFILFVSRSVYTIEQSLFAMGTNYNAVQYYYRGSMLARSFSIQNPSWGNWMWYRLNANGIEGLSNVALSGYFSDLLNVPVKNGDTGTNGSAVLSGLVSGNVLSDYSFVGGYSPNTVPSSITSSSTKAQIKTAWDAIKFTLQALGNCGFTFGNGVVNVGSDSIVVGLNCFNGSDESAVFGKNNVAGNTYSFTAGEGLVNGNADGTYNSSHTSVFGRFNKITGAFIRMVGNGTADNARSNCEELTPNGELWEATDVMCGGVDLYSPAHKLSQKINDAPTDGKKYVRRSSLWESLEGELQYKGVVASASNLPGNPTVVSYGSGDTAVVYKCAFTFNPATGKCTTMTLKVEPAGTNTSAWFRNAENILRNDASVLSLNGTLLEYGTDFTTNPTTSGPWGQGVDTLVYTFNVDVYEDDVLTFNCNTWATNNSGNGYKISDTNYTVVRPEADMGDLYFVQDESEVYMYDGFRWFSFAPNDVYQLNASHLTLVNGYHNYFNITDPTTGTLTVTIPDGLANGKYEIDTCNFSAPGQGIPAIGGFTSSNRTVTYVANYTTGVGAKGWKITLYVTDNNVYVYYSRG